MMISNVPISPPVTPKEWLHTDFEVKQDFLLLSPIDSYHAFNHKKSIPRKSLPSTTKGSFTMDLHKVLPSITGIQKRVELSKKRTQPIFSTSSILNTERHVKKAKTDAAAAYDCVDITVPDHIIFKDDPKWIPNMNVFSQKHIKVNWKGSPLKINHLPYYQELHPGEVHIASTLRLTPEQYLKCRRALILAGQDFNRMNTAFRKSDAQKCVRIDVNKTSALWSVFNQLGWFNPSPSFV